MIVYHVPGAVYGTENKVLKDVVCVLEKLKSIRPNRSARRQFEDSVV